MQLYQNGFNQPMAEFIAYQLRMKKLRAEQVKEAHAKFTDKCECELCNF